jgi:hypothetical protein
MNKAGARTLAVSSPTPSAMSSAPRYSSGIVADALQVGNRVGFGSASGRFKSANLRSSKAAPGWELPD